MANMKNYSDWQGETYQIVGNLRGINNAEFAKLFPGVTGKRCDSYSMWAGYGMVDGKPTLLPLTRSIEFKQNPSRHECDSRCMNATGRIMKCECKCGGKNHGRGVALTCV